MKAIKAKGIEKSYGKLQVLKGVDFEVDQGEVVSLVGASGAGKSTLLHILGTLDQADSGGVEIMGEPINGLKNQALADFRNKNIGFVFQFHNLLPELNCLENICLPGLIAGEELGQVHKRMENVISLLGLEPRLEHKPAELSGGEQQRTAVARALANNPSIIFADEPSGNLDSANAQELHKLFFKLREELNQTIVVVTHNEDLAKQADRQMTIRDGLIY